ncbi:hypothetical protein NCS52_00600800 [Fusarium sp. LHS14.1]|nr:hypothetical protein NCS52_00600800 [Fusarium sp. LHS14.1]
MAPTSPDKPDARRSRSRPPLYSFSGTIRHQLPVIPRPSQRPSRFRLPPTEATVGHPPTGRFDRVRRLSRSFRPIRKSGRSMVPRSQRSNATFIAGIDRSLRSRPGVLDQSREPPAPVDSKHHQSPYKPLSSIPSKRAHPVDGNNDSRCSHDSQQKRHCLVHQDVSESFHTTTTATDLLPQISSINHVVPRPSIDKCGDEFPKEDQCHSMWPLASAKSDTTISLGKQKDSTTGQRTTPARATKEHNQLDQSTRSIDHQVKPLSKRPGDDGLPSETFDAKAYQQLESPRRTALSNTEGGPYDELANPNNLSELKKSSRDKSETSKSPGPTTTPGLGAWPLIFACIATFIGGMFLTELRFPDFRIPEFRAVDWNERVIELEIALATIPRVVLFGEASLSHQGVHPGMLPVDGLAHDHNPSFRPTERIPVRSKWFSNSIEFPQYEPWLTTSSGVFVPEGMFLEDLWVVTHDICLDLSSIPIPDGSSPSEDFCFLLAHTLSDLTSFYTFDFRQFGSYYTGTSLDMNEVMLFNMETLQEMQRNGSEELGSDQLRASALHAPSTTTVSLPTAEPPSPHHRLPTDTSIPGDIPESFIKGWRDAMAARSSRIKQEHVSTTTPTSDTTASSKIHVSRLGKELIGLPETPTPRDYAEAQMNNGTANILVNNVIDVIVGRRLNETDEVEGPTYGNIIEHSVMLDKFCDLFPRLNNHISKAIRSANRTELNAYELSRLRRVQDIAPFLRDIAVPRLDGMQARAKRGVLLLRETERRQAELQREIKKTLRNGWLGPRVEWLSRRIICYYLPDLKSMALQWSHARQWLAVESEEVFEIYQGRQAEFRLLNPRHPDSLSKKQLFEWHVWRSYMVWSRWSLEDRRKYPEGKESFCWKETDWDPFASTWQRMVGWVTGRENVGIPSQCGDASKRHG